MTVGLDMTDIPAVSADALAGPMQYFIDSGRGLVMMRGLSKDDMRTLRQVLRQQCADVPTATEVAMHLRFRSLIDVFAARRLKDLLMLHGHALLGPAIAVAANMRLNTKWGFSPQKFLVALQAALEAQQQTARHVPSEFELALAARQAPRPAAATALESQPLQQAA